MTDIRVLPADDATNGWNRILPARTPRPPLAGDRRADWAVVGAGTPPEWRAGPRGNGARGTGTNLQAANARLGERVAELEAELERIRETLRP